MPLAYTYPQFDQEQNPRVPLAAVEYVLMRKDLNNFMHDMLRRLYKDDQFFSPENKFHSGRMLFFGLVFSASVAGLILLDHPGWLMISATLAIIMLMAVFAVPITFWQDNFKWKKERKFKIDSIKSYYLFHYSLIRNSKTYNEYLTLLPDADLNRYQLYLKQYQS